MIVAYIFFCTVRAYEGYILEGAKFRGTTQRLHTLYSVLLISTTMSTAEWKQTNYIIVYRNTGKVTTSTLTSEILLPRKLT